MVQGELDQELLQVRECGVKQEAAEVWELRGQCGAKAGGHSAVSGGEDWVARGEVCVCSVTQCGDRQGAEGVMPRNGRPMKPSAHTSMLHPTSNAKKGQGLTQLTWPPTSFRGASQPESLPGHLQVPPRVPCLGS